MRYAENTTISSDKSRAEIEKLVAKYGASKFAYAWEDAHDPGAEAAGRAQIQFVLANRHIRFLLPMPSRNDKSITHTASRKWQRSDAEQERAYEQAVRQRWRALALVIKAKLEAVAAGITEFESEFLANIVMPDNRTVAEHVRPQIERAYIDGKVPAMLTQF